MAANCFLFIDQEITRLQSNLVNINIEDVSLGSGDYYVNLVLYSDDNKVLLHNSNQLIFSIYSRPVMWGSHYQPKASATINTL